MNLLPSAAPSVLPPFLFRSLQVLSSALRGPLCWPGSDPSVYLPTHHALLDPPECTAGCFLTAAGTLLPSWGTSPASLQVPEGGTDGARSARHPWILCSWRYSDSDAGLPGRTSNFLMSPLLCLWGRFLDFYFATLSLITHSYYQNFNNIHEFRLPSPPRSRWLPRALLVGMDASLPSQPLSSGLRAAAYPAGPGRLLGQG